MSFDMEVLTVYKELDASIIRSFLDTFKEVKDFSYILTNSPENNYSNELKEYCVEFEDDMEIIFSKNTVLIVVDNSLLIIDNGDSQFESITEIYK